MIKECFDGIMRNSVDPFVKELETCSDLLGKLEKVVDKELDKPMDDSRPNYVAGDCLNDIRGIVDDTRIQLNYVRRIVRAYAAAWDYDERDTDAAETARLNFVRGFMEGIISNI